MKQPKRIVLEVVRDLKGEGYGVTIHEEHARRHGREVSIGWIYVVLGDFEERGWVTTRMGEGTPERGLRDQCRPELGYCRKRHYTISDAGLRALESLDAPVRPNLIYRLAAVRRSLVRRGHSSHL